MQPPSTPRPRRLLEVLQAAADYLAVRQVEQPRLTFELLAAHVLNCRRLELYLRFDQVLTEPQIEALRAGVRRLGAGEPLQYVAGVTEFRGRLFRTDRRALIPRPETELLVDAVLGCEPLWTRIRPAVADVGTGSGCIAVSLALERPEAEYHALDLSADALALAAENARQHGVAGRIRFAPADLLESAEPAAFDAVVANLPYVPTARWEALPVHIREYEPRAALDGGPDGLALIARLAPQAAATLRPGGALFLEIGADQAPAVTRLLRDAGFAEPRMVKDLAGHPRVVWAGQAPQGVSADPRGVSNP